MKRDPPAAAHAALPDLPAPGAASHAPSADCELGYLVKRLQHRLRQVLERTLSSRGVDVGFAALAALSALRARPGRSGAQLARDGFVSPQTMSSLLRQLEADRCVVRDPHPENARIDRWRLSPRGADVLARAEAALGPLDRHVSAALTDHEQQLFRRCIGKLAAALETWDAALGPTRKDDDDA